MGGEDSIEDAEVVFGESWGCVGDSGLVMPQLL